ncbi:MAG TPA: HEAT repeat domain-containing protein, partial [Isosphaeraceae bacterium]|nr:HEAT repeat domain-containing protein [Isosphaeraceae bacterium]
LRGVGKDGTTIQLSGGGMIRIRPDGTGLEVVSRCERNPPSVMLSATDEIFTFGNDDDSPTYPIVGGHHGYPYPFLIAPRRALPTMAGQIVGSGARGICNNEDGLPARYRGNLFVCDRGLQTVFRCEVVRAGGTSQAATSEPLVTRGDVPDFRPFSLAISGDGASLLLIDRAPDGGPKAGRLYRLSYEGPDRAPPAPRPTGADPAARLAALDHPAASVRLESQRILARMGERGVGPLVARLRDEEGMLARLHALWALDAIGTTEARRAIREVLNDREAEVRLQAARSAGIRRDRAAFAALANLLRDDQSCVRREAAIALGKLGDPSAGSSLIAALGDPDAFAAWAVRWAIRTLGAWDEGALTAALLDGKRRDDALRLADESWAVPVVNALNKALAETKSAPERARIVATLAGLDRQSPERSGDRFGTNPLAGEFPEKARDRDAAGMSAAFRGLAAGLDDPDAGVRLEAIVGLRGVGSKAAPILRARLARETDERAVIALVQALGLLGDGSATAPLAALVQHGGRSEAVRAAALDALGMIGGPASLRARLTLAYDPKAPVALVARALPPLGREKVLPPNDLAGFFDHPEPAIRAAALRALTTRREDEVPAEVRRAVLSRLHDQAPEVRTAAIEAVVALPLREAVPLLVPAALDEATRAEASLALAALPDARALPVYLAALRDHDPDLRRRAESALLAIRDQVAGDLAKEARSGRLSGPAALALERILTRFRPVVPWRVIGPFPRTTAPVFFGVPSIDFTRTHTGAEGRTIAWTPREGDPATGRVVLDDLKGGAGDQGGFGDDTDGSPDLGAFGFAEFESDRDRPALMLVGSSGSITIAVNDAVVFRPADHAGRADAPDSDHVRIDLKQGKNRILVSSRQGIGPWSFSVQVSEPSQDLVASKPEGVAPEALRTFALNHDGDPRKGESIFFDPKGIGCLKCHAAGGRGTAGIGPDLTGLALKYDKAELVRSVLEPSDRIATGYRPVLLALRDGKVLTGLVRSETDSYVEIVDADAKLTRVPKAEVEGRRVGDISIMPTGLVDTLTPLEFTDLISYLQSLKANPTR